MLTRMRAVLPSPPACDDPDEARLARILNVLLVSFQAGSILVVTISLLAGDSNTALIIGLGGLINLGVLALFRRGRIRTAGFITLLNLAAALTAILLEGGGIHDTAVMAYPIVLFTGSHLLRRRSFILLTVLVIAAIAGVAYAEMSGLITTPYSARTDLADPLVIGIILALTAISVHLISTNLNQALAEARRGEREMAAVHAQMGIQAEGLKASEARWRSLVATAPDLILTLLPDGTIEFANEEVTHALGLSLSALIGQNIHSVPQSDGAVMMRQLVQTAVASGQPASAGGFVPLPDGTRHWFEARIGPVVQDDRVTRLMVIARDTTGLRDTQEALRESEARLHAALQTLPFAFHIWDTDGRYVLQNPVSSGWWGDLIGRRPEDQAVPGWARSLWEDNVRRALKGETVRGEVAYTFREQPYVVDSLVAPVYDGAKIVGVLGLDVDITERKLAEEAVRASEEQYRRLVEDIDEVIFSIDDRGVLTYISPAIEKLSGFRPGELLGRDIRELAYADDVPAVLETVARMGQGASIPLDLRILDRTGQVRWVRVTGRPILEGPRLAGLRGAMADITERKRADLALVALNAELEERVAERTQELADAYGRLKELDRLKTKFVTDVSHELRTPVTNLGLYLGLLERGRPEKQAEYMGVLREQTDRLGRLIEDILGWSTLVQEKERFSPEPVDLNRLIQPLVDALQARSDHPDVTVTSKLEPGCMVMGDRIQLAQVITNLLANALSYTLKGSIHVATSWTADRACLEVADTGLGIDPEDLPHIFDRFYRGSRSVQLNLPGSGLGLAIVREIVELHSGTVSVESTPGMGAAFRVLLPRAAGSTGETAAKVPAKPEGPGDTAG